MARLKSRQRGKDQEHTIRDQDQMFETSTMWRYKISGHCFHCSPLTGIGLHDAHACLSAGVGWGCSPRCCLSTDRLMHTVNGSGRTRRCVSLILYTVIYTWCGFGSSYAYKRFSRNFHCLPEVYIWACHVACSHKTLRYCERQLMWKVLARACAFIRAYCVISLTTEFHSLLHSVNRVVFTLLLVHLILCISPHHSHHLRSHHLSVPRPFTRLKTHLFHKSFPP